MPDSPLVAAGAQVQPTAAGCLHTNEFFTGMWTQGNPLGAGAVPFLQQKFYAASRFDRLIGGQNTEITTRLTLARRPGNSVYNAGPFPPINRFYEFRAFTGSTEEIHVLASVDPNLVTANRNVASVQVVTVGPPFFRSTYLIVTFTAAVPAYVTGQTYTFSGLTTYVGINGVALDPWTPASGGTPPPALTGFQQAFLYLAPNYGPVADTGGALISPVTGGTATVRDVTGPANNITLWNKNPLAGRTSFQSVGNLCFFADNYDRKKWVRSAASWEALTLYTPGAFIVDANENLQEAIGAQTANIVNIQVELIVIGGLNGRKVTLFFDPATPLDIQSNISLTLAGLTTVPLANGQTPYTVQPVSSVQAFFVEVGIGLPPITGFSVETGTAATGTGISGAAAPAWNANLGLPTQDGGLQWINKGPSVQNWGIDTPLVAPIVTQVAAPSVYPAWAADTWYAPGAFVIIDSNGNVQKLTTGGVTGAAHPVWSAIVGGVTADNTAAWTCLGAPGWAATTAFAVGAVVVVTFTYYVTTSQSIPYPPYVILTQTAYTVTLAFEATIAGTSGANQPAWSNGNNTTAQDNTVTWTNIGTAPAWPANANVSTASVIEDPNGNLQKPQHVAKSGAVIPAVWQPKAGELTADGGTQTWLNSGPYTPAGTAAWIWAYSGKNSITGHISTASPLSPALTVAQSNQAVIQAPGLANDPQIDTIVLWRTVQGGSTLLFLDEIPNPALGTNPGLWIYTDTTPDSLLNEFITAPIAQANNPPPVGFTPQAYYLNRIWGYVNNKLVWSGGPDTITGSGDEAFPPINQFTFPSQGVTCWPTSIGLVCYTNSDVWVVLGQGTPNSPFYVINFQAGVGLANQDAFAVNGSTAYGMLTSGQVVSMDPGAGELEVGFPIGDRFNAEYTGAGTYMAWHQGSSADMALYVGDGALGWYRMAAVASPESGNVWSPRALINNGVKALASIEIAPGQKRLLLGPAAQNQPILMRDATVAQDNGVSYTATAILASVVMAQPGTNVAVQFVVTEEMAIAGSSPVAIGILYDEISGVFSNLTRVSNDPPNLAKTKTVITRRFWAMQNAQPVICRHLQTQVSWAAEPYLNELLTHSIYGRLPEKARK